MVGLVKLAVRIAVLMAAAIALAAILAGLIVTLAFRAVGKLFGWCDAGADPAPVQQQIAKP